MIFAELPAPLTAQCQPLLDQIQSIFTGEFDKLIIQPNGTSDFLFADKDLLSRVQIPQRGITELDRLSYVIT